MQETIFISKLVGSQSITALAVMTGHSLNEDLNKSSVGAISSIVQLLVASVVGLWSTKLDVNRNIYSRMATDCHSQHGFVDLSLSFGRNDFAIKITKVLGVGTLIFLGGVFIYSITGAFGLLQTLHLRINKRLPESRMSLFRFVTLFYIDMVCMVEIYNLLSVRRLALRAAGQNSADGWDFGQILPIMLWIPFFLVGLKYLIS